MTAEEPTVSRGGRSKRLLNRYIQTSSLLFYPVLLLLVAIIGLSILWQSQNTRQLQQPTATVKNQTFTLDIADTDSERVQGLSGRGGLARDQAMLFVFDEVDTHCFWMKDMRFSIDMIWLDENRRVNHIVTDASPASYPDNFCPKKPGKYVLEVTSGTSRTLGLKTGDGVSLSLP